MDNGSCFVKKLSKYSNHPLDLVPCNCSCSLFSLIYHRFPRILFISIGILSQTRVISTLLKALEEINERTPSGSKRGHAGGRFSIEELGMTEYYTNGLLKEIPSKPTFRKKYKIYGAWAKEASPAIIKILSKFEKRLIKNCTDDYSETLLMGKKIERKWIAITLQKNADKNLKGDEKKNVLKFLKSDDQGMIMMGASMLKGILKE